MPGSSRFTRRPIVAPFSHACHVRFVDTPVAPLIGARQRRVRPVRIERLAYLAVVQQIKPLRELWSGFGPRIERRLQRRCDVGGAHHAGQIVRNNHQLAVGLG